MTPLRLVFLGSDAIALPLLEWLVDGGSAIAQVVAVFTKPDRAVGRGQKVAPNAIKQWALGRGLPVLQPEKLTPETIAELANLKADVALVMAYGHILRDEFISTPRLGTLNLHTSLLPKYRGASPIQTAIANGDRETGVTLMRIVRQLDAGPLADAERVAIGSLDTAADVEAKLSTACVPLVARSLPRLRDGALGFTVQDSGATTYCRKLAKPDGQLDFIAPASALAARINGLFPWPTCSVQIGDVPVKLGLADALDGAGEPGVVIGSDPEGLLVGTGTGQLRIRRLQRPGGRMLPAADFLRGFAVARGTVLVSQPMAALVASALFPR